MEITEFKLSQHIDPFFEDWSYWLVDFRRHMKPEIVLEKKVVYEVNGRPEYADYTHNGELMAKLRWTFTNFPGSFLMMRRQEEISYVRNDGSEGDWFKIKDQTYDLSDVSHRDIVFHERVRGRKFILNDVKGVVMGTLQALNPGKTEEEITEMGGAFWELHSAELSSFIDTGSKHIVQKIGSDVTTLWLQDPIDPVNAPGVTIGMHMQSRLNF